jgi:hypothetical protein
MIYRGHVQNGVVVFDGRIELPEGTEVTIEPLPTPARKTLAEQFADVIGSVQELPPDMAQNHDHYVHGTPKP